MPELPEVEATRRLALPFVQGQRITSIVVRESRLRVPVSPLLAQQRDLQVTDLLRRGKYLLLFTTKGMILIHLGMSGRLSVLQPPIAPPQRHDHVDVLLANGHVLRYCDPRRFGLMVWWEGQASHHPLLASLGPDPFDAACSPDYLAAHAAGRRVAIQPWLMDGRTMAGIGNIYAAESLFRTRLHPATPAGTVLPAYWARLLVMLQHVLSEAIAQCGTTLRDFRTPMGATGGYGTALRVYGRTGQPCLYCGSLIQRLVLRQRSTFFCPSCQGMCPDGSGDSSDLRLADTPGV